MKCEAHSQHWKFQACVTKIPFLAKKDLVSESAWKHKYAGHQFGQLTSIQLLEFCIHLPWSFTSNALSQALLAKYFVFGSGQNTRRCKYINADVKNGCVPDLSSYDVLWLINKGYTFLYKLISIFHGLYFEFC